ncbi:hypothetical protein KKE92_03300 [Candidatus Micrarchaeota archaeon]|nr:hypothetical protein [Candidatus Micrarchaeota archaeon]MBU1681656.1 hypothetical protein [Candidatus Micrarchaeota archaeon]
MKLFVIALILASINMAFTVNPDFIGVQDTGSKSLPTMDVELSIDCETKDLTVTATSEDEPIDGASTVMFYTDYGYQPLPNPGKTGSDGSVTMTVPGTINFLTGLFILRVDHQAYQSREIEFAYEKCFEDPPPEVEPEPVVDEEPEEEVTPPEETVPDEETSPTVNESKPEVIVEPVEVPDETEESTAACPIGILLLSMLAIRVIR